MRVRVPQHVRGEDELGMDRLADEPHPGLVRQSVAFLEVAAQAGGDDVRPRGVAAARARQDVVHGEPLAAVVAVLTGVAVATKDVLLVERDAVQERLANVDGEADDRRQRKRARGGADDARRALDGLGLAGEKERDGATGVGEMQRLEGMGEYPYRYLIPVASE